jgi:predicted dinucleotide-binding enzyme
MKERKDVMSRETRYVVVGAGHGGKAMAAHLAVMGFPVTLYNRTPENVSAIKERGGIGLRSYEGGPRGFGELALVTSDMGSALKQADVIMVVVPSTAHRDIARKASRHLRDGRLGLGLTASTSTNCSDPPQRSSAPRDERSASQVLAVCEANSSETRRRRGHDPVQEGRDLKGTPLNRRGFPRSIASDAT